MFKFFILVATGLLLSGCSLLRDCTHSKVKAYLSSTGTNAESYMGYSRITNTYMLEDGTLYQDSALYQIGADVCYF